MIYATTESYRKQRLFMNVLNGVFMVLFMAVLSMVITRHMSIDAGQFFYKMMFGIGGFLFLEMIILGYIVYRKMKHIQFQLTEEGIIRLGKKTQKISYDSITNVTAVYQKNGDLTTIKIKAKPLPLQIIGVEEQEAILMAIKENVSPEKVITKTAKVNWYSMKTFLLTWVVMVAIFIPLAGFGIEQMGLLSQLILFGFSIYIIVARPMYKYYGSKMKYMDFILGGIIILTSSFSIISRMLLLF